MITSIQLKPARSLKGQLPSLAWLLLGILLSGYAGLRFVRAVILTSSHEDFLVYRRGGLDFINHVSLYSERSALPFTYPPFAAVFFGPLGWFPQHISYLLWLAICMAGAGLCSWLFVRDAAWRSYRSSQPVGWIMVMVLVGLTFAPSSVSRTFELGQINLILMMLIVVDLFLLPTKYRGVLTGIAAGIKLTPAIFLFYFLVSRQFKPLFRMVAGGIATVIIGWLLLPHDSIKFWTKIIFDPSRVGDLAYLDNVSSTAVFRRFSLTLPTVMSMLLSVLILVGACYVAHRAWCRHDRLASVLAIALCGLLVSPVSWSHHWVWVSGLLIWSLSHRRYGLAAASLILTLITPLELATINQFWAVVLANSYVGLGAYALWQFGTPYRRHEAATQP